TCRQNCALYGTECVGEAVIPAFRFRRRLIVDCYHPLHVSEHDRGSRGISRRDHPAGVGPSEPYRLFCGARTARYTRRSRWTEQCALSEWSTDGTPGCGFCVALP